MTLDLVRDAFLWCFAINMGMLLLWFAFLALARDWVYRMHSRWYKISFESFNAIHYAGMMTYKIAIFALFLIPYFALLIVG